VTLGQQVRAELPGGGEVLGLASEIDSAGQLVILTPEAISLSAADVWHLRN
jgi:BirA family biotin operon repressor/biotin-[acetyl-CoA-carboxylase] ligase